MSAGPPGGFDGADFRREASALDRRDILTLQIARAAAFGIAALGVFFQVLAAVQGKSIDGDTRAWFLGGIAVGFLIGEIIKLKRRVNELEDRLGSSSGAN